MFEKTCIGISLFGLLVAIACKEEEVSDEKFMSLQHQDQEWAAGYAPNLIEKIHADSWVIAYGFYDNKNLDPNGEEFERCADDYREHHSAIEEKIRGFLQKWMTPLADIEIVPGKKLIAKSGIKFTTTDITTIGEDEGYEFGFIGTNGKLILADGQPQPDLGIIFYCGMDQNKRLPSWVDVITYKDEGYALVHMSPYAEKRKRESGVPKLDDEAFLTTNRKYLKFTLLHELGHAFGLADTYIRSEEENTGGNKKTRGINPLSIMSSSEFWRVMDFPNDVELTLDDREGIKWLYTYHHRGESLTSCPEGYRFEEPNSIISEQCYTEHDTVGASNSDTDKMTESADTVCVKEEVEVPGLMHGCVPTHPVIFAVKQGNLAVLKNLLADDKKLNIDEQDELGNTALHYAVMREKRHGGDMCQYLLDKKAKCYIQNKRGTTPYSLYPESKCLNKNIKRMVMCSTEESFTTCKDQYIASSRGQLVSRDAVCAALGGNEHYSYIKGADENGLVFPRGHLLTNRATKDRMFLKHCCIRK